MQRIKNLVIYIIYQILKKSDKYIYRTIMQRDRRSKKNQFKRNILKMKIIKYFLRENIQYEQMRCFNRVFNESCKYIINFSDLNTLNSNKDFYFLSSY